MDCRLRIDGRAAPVARGASLFEAAEAIGVRVPTSCRKQGKCRECLVEIESGAELLTPPTPEEAHLGGRFRLSCRARCATAGTVEAHTLRRGQLQIESAARGLEPPKPSTRSPRFRRSDRKLLLEDSPIGTIEGPPLGVAVDLGTTTVVVSLEDLESGAHLATTSFENPQRFGGSEIMARIRYDGEHRGRLLQRVLLGYLGRAIGELPCDRSNIVEVVVAANTTMRDLFFGLDVSSIGQLPYRSSTEHELDDGKRMTTSLEQRARRLRLDLHPEARLYGLPLVSGHVGADAAAVLLATGIAERVEPAACMDIGTNTEVFIGNRDRILAASCPAGPAFEGGGVLCGAPALDGAIERVTIQNDGTVELDVIGDREPIGICGSGLVDLLGELRRTGRMNAQGRYADGSARFEIDRQADIALTEGDINELAQAKGANAAGLRIVARCFGFELGQLEEFFLAGGFGRHLDVAAAQRIGLIPTLPHGRVVQVGNAALEGARRVLHSVEQRRTLEGLVRNVEHISLESQEEFFDDFVDGCQFERFGSRTTEGSDD